MVIKKVVLQFLSFYELCIFRRSSQANACQLEFDSKQLTGSFSVDEIKLAVTAFNATIIPTLTA